MIADWGMAEEPAADQPEPPPPAAERPTGRDAQVRDAIRAALRYGWACRRDGIEIAAAGDATDSARVAAAAFAKLEAAVRRLAEPAQ